MWPSWSSDVPTKNRARVLDHKHCVRFLRRRRYHSSRQRCMFVSSTGCRLLVWHCDWMYELRCVPALVNAAGTACAGEDPAQGTWAKPPTYPLVRPRMLPVRVARLEPRNCRGRRICDDPCSPPMGLSVLGPIWQLRRNCVCVCVHGGGASGSLATNARDPGG